jgi:hypothetical protein
MGRRLVLTARGGVAALALLAGCGGGAGPWGIDPQLVDRWSQTDLTEDGFPAYFVRRVMDFRADGSWRSDSLDGSWSTGGYRTRSGRLNYWIEASDDPGNVGDEYTFDYTAAAHTMTIRGRYLGHYYVATFARLQ